MYLTFVFYILEDGAWLVETCRNILCVYKLVLLYLYAFVCSIIGYVL